MVRRTRRGKKQPKTVRRTRRSQRGGAVQNIEEWLNAVKASPAFKKEEDRFKPDEARPDALKLGTYRLADLKDASLALPEQTENDSNFDINKLSGDDPQDLRIEGANLVAKWTPVIGIDPSPTAAEFRDYIQLHMGAEVDSADPDFRDAVHYLIGVENKLRRGETTISALTEEDKYPLFVWALMMNLPEKVDAAPSLISKKQVQEELSSQGLSEPNKAEESAAPTEQLI